MAIDNEAMRAAFNAGWAAACMTLADSCAKGGQMRQANLLHQMANQPPPVEVGDLSTPEGQAMRRGSEVVMMERITRAEPAASPADGATTEVKP
jgi:hypothetical protein